jgi:hypothetical protein
VFAFERKFGAGTIKTKVFNYIFWFVADLMWCYCANLLVPACSGRRWKGVGIGIGMAQCGAQLEFATTKLSGFLEHIFKKCALLI